LLLTGTIHNNEKNETYIGIIRLLFERYLKHEIDLETLKQGLETIDAETQRKHYQGIGYA